MKRYLQLLLASLALIAGLALLIAAFVVEPTGEIHNSVLVAYGETLTFVGSLVGIDYHYQQRQ